MEKAVSNNKVYWALLANDLDQPTSTPTYYNGGLLKKKEKVSMSV